MEIQFVALHLHDNYRKFSFRYIKGLLHHKNDTNDYFLILTCNTPNECWINLETGQKESEMERVFACACEPSFSIT